MVATKVYMVNKSVHGQYVEIDIDEVFADKA